MFAISFAFISVAVGIFGTYDDVLQNAGPAASGFGRSSAVGQTLIALVIAQFAARIPLSGSSYQWASRLANPKIGWGFGWLSFCYLVIGVARSTTRWRARHSCRCSACEPDEGTARMITLAVLVIQAVLAMLSTRLVGLINSAAVGLELAIVVVLTIALLIAVAVTGDGSVSNLTSRGVAEGAPDYFAIGGGLMAAMIMGLGTLVGFDAAANMAEEAKDPFRTVPRAIVGSVVAAAVLGMVLADRAHDRDQGHPTGHRHRLAGRSDPARPTGSGDGALAAGRDRLRILRRRLGDPGHLRPDGVRDVARLALSRTPVDASGQPAHEDTGSGDHPDRRRGIRLDGRAAWWRTAGDDHGGRAIGAVLYGATIVLYLGCGIGWGARTTRSISDGSTFPLRSARWCGRSSWWSCSYRRRRP